MADEKDEKITEKTEYRCAVPLYGRKQIYTSIDRFDPNDEEAIIAEVNSALSIHVENLIAMEYLYWYRRGLTPVIARTKEVRPEICARISVNYADEICSFADGYFMTQPAFYVSRKKDEAISEKVGLLNDYLLRSGKQLADNKTVDWFHTVGKGDIFITASDDKDTPFRAYALDPRSAFVVKSLAPGNRPVYSVHTVVSGDRLMIDVSDDTYTYILEGTVTGKLTTTDNNYICTASSVLSRTINPIGHVPIIEYFYNSVSMSKFEAAIPLIDATSFLQSDRLDAVDQAVQSLLVFYNCELEDEDGGAATPAMIRAAGALFLKSVGENKADLKEIVTNLDQSQTQIFIDNLREQILSICSMPNNLATRGFGNHATGTVALVDNGWYQADTAARNTEDLFCESNAYFDEIILHILREKNLLDLKPEDIKLQFVRNETANAQSKAQTLATYLAAGLAPQLALAKSGASNDPVADYEQSKDWIMLRWGDPSATEDTDVSFGGSAEAPGAEDVSALSSSSSESSGSKGGGRGNVRSYTQMRRGRKVTVSGYQKRVSDIDEK